MSWIMRCLAAVALLMGMAVPASASRVSPMILDLEPTGRSSIARVELVNDGLNDIPYEVQMMRGIISPEGKLQLTPADAEFVVFPAQTLVQSNSQQVFRIQYVGEGALDRSEVYYMSIRQIPVAFKPGVSQVQMVINYNVLVNVVPDGSRPEPVVRSALVETRLVEEEGSSEVPEAGDEIGDEPAATANGLTIDLGNSGSRYFLAGLSNWTISGTTVAGEPYEARYSGDEMSRVIGVGVVAPDANRVFFVPTGEPLRPDGITISVEP